MSQNIMSKLLKYIIGGAIWAGIIILIGIIIESLSSLTLMDILYFESLIIILISGIALTGVVPTWMSVKYAGQKTIQDVPHENPEVEEIEIEDQVDKVDSGELNATLEEKIANEESKRIFQKPANLILNVISLMIGGVICLIIAALM